MKNLVSLLLLIHLFLYLTACDSSSPTESEDSNIDYSADLEEYFPSNSQLKYNYSVDTLNTSENAFNNIGNRVFSFNSQMMSDYSDYYLYDHSYNIDGEEFKTTSAFRYLENSLIIKTDTTDVSKSIPDSLLGLLTIFIDQETTLLQFPLEENKAWPVLKVNIDFGSFKFNILDISGEYVKSETLFVEGFNETLESDHVRYKLDLNVPDLSNPFLSTSIKTYYANVWFVEGKGIVKLEGCSLFINPISGMHIDFSDSNKVSRQTLISVE